MLVCCNVNNNRNALTHTHIDGLVQNCSISSVNNGETTILHETIDIYI